MGLKLERVDLVDVGALRDSSWNKTGVCFPNSWGFKGRDAERNVEEKKVTLPASLYEGNPPGAGLAFCAPTATEAQLMLNLDVWPLSGIQRWNVCIRTFDKGTTSHPPRPVAHCFIVGPVSLKDEESVGMGTGIERFSRRVVSGLAMWYRSYLLCRWNTNSSKGAGVALPTHVG